MKEIGGYFELERNRLPLLHEDAIALNSGGSCLAYLIRARKIRTIWLPYMLCDSVEEICRREDVRVRKYHIDRFYMPRDVELKANEWLYVVNLYGQLSASALMNLKRQYSQIIVDQAHAYFMPPISDIDMIYISWKYFGVPDGAFLYTDCRLEQILEQGESFLKMGHLLGRFERTASEFYAEYIENSEMTADEDVKIMSKLTKNLLRGIDYQYVKNVRTNNFRYLSERLEEYNELKVITPDGAFSYPFMIKKGHSLKKKLIEEKIYIPTLWPNVLEETRPGSFEHGLAEDLLPLPVDQRYGINEMEFIVNMIERNL